MYISKIVKQTRLSCLDKASSLEEVKTWRVLFRKILNTVVHHSSVQLIQKNPKGNLHGVVAKMIACNIIVSKFEFQWCFLHSLLD